MIDSNRLKTSIHIEKLKFASRQDYFDFFIENNFAENINGILENPKMVSAIHEHWHGQGSNGCIFALLAARERDERGWKQLILTDEIDSIISNKTLGYINTSIQEAIDDSSIEVLSLLFSKIDSYEHLVKLIKSLIQLELINLTYEEEIDDKVILSLRTPVNDPKVLSWLMAFAPFDSFPKTRQSPITEIAIRVKPKPKEQFYRLTKGDDDAHLADLPIPHSVKVSERIWDNTLKRTAIILNEKPNIFSAAKTTFTLPAKYWH
ncbi:hypothetical protein [Yeosuana marina]|uniref:hypothetical protein n=1 Tax=Yeosuana marina TaxID=1565536 RepID=UPI0030C7B2B8